ncbi:MAG: xanthine dehydrogenase family protein subunit M [Chloroflexota bacterium]
MKPAPFAYSAPATLAEALSTLAQYGYEAKLLAGGQSLIPALNFRLAQPSRLIDLNRLAELDYIQEDADGGLRLGAMTRHRRLERDPLVAKVAPLLHETMPYVAHPQIRNRGTLGGSLAHADPAAELPVIALALQARLRLRSSQGERWVAAEEFFLGLFTTALAPEEILVEVTIPPMPPRTGWSFLEVSRRPGDYAQAGVAALATLDESGVCRQARLVYLSLGEMPMVAREAAGLLVGQRPDVALIQAVAEVASQQEIEPTADIHASVAYKRHLARVLTRRALQQALARV